MQRRSTRLGADLFRRLMQRRLPDGKAKRRIKLYWNFVAKILDQVDIRILGRLLPVRSPSGLIRMEAQLGGRHVVHTDSQSSDFHIGGDRMARSQHGYARAYARVLKRVIEPAPTIVEIGVLTGSGLALWKRIFPEARIVGFDHQLDPALMHLPAYCDKLGVSMDGIELHKLDAFDPDAELVRLLFSEREISMVIDDGPHVLSAIVRMRSVLAPYLSENCQYIVEDAPETAAEFAREFLVQHLRADASGIYVSQVHGD